jgi:hypothetical protein
MRKRKREALIAMCLGGQHSANERQKCATTRLWSTVGVCYDIDVTSREKGFTDHNLRFCTLRGTSGHIQRPPEGM